MKRLIKKSSSNKNEYDDIIDSLMSNDSNGTWDEIWDEVKYDYDLTDENEILKKSLNIVIDSISSSLENYSPEEETYEFYYNIRTKANQLKLNL